MSEHWIQCAMNGRLYRDSSLGIWDDGEWISWDYINDHLADLELQAQYPHATRDAALLFESLIEHAAAYSALTGRFLEIWGELGELYVETRFGLRRHPAYREGSDGTLDGAETEVKTLSPLRRSDCARVKNTNGFECLVVVKISEDFSFEARRFTRGALRGGGKLLRAHWEDGEDMSGAIRAERTRAERLLDLLDRLEDDFELP